MTQHDLVTGAPPPFIWLAGLLYLYAEGGFVFKILLNTKKGGTRNEAALVAHL